MSPQDSLKSQKGTKNMDPAQVATDVGQTAVDYLVVQEKAGKPTGKQDVKEIAKKLIAPPDATVSKSETRRSMSTLARILILVAIAVIALGLLFLILKLTLGMAVILVGILPIIIIILAPLPSR